MAHTASRVSRVGILGACSRTFAVNDPIRAVWAARFSPPRRRWRIGGGEGACATRPRPARAMSMVAYEWSVLTPPGGGGASQTWLAVNARHVGRWGRARTCVLSRKLRSLAPALALVSVRVLWMVERIVLMALLEVEPPFTGEPGEFLP
jgi:hypothetical protein